MRGKSDIHHAFGLRHLEPGLPRLAAAVRGRAVPVVLAGLEEDAVACADDLGRAAVALAQPDASVTKIVWPCECVCQAVRVPGVKRTSAAANVELPAGAAMASMQTAIDIARAGSMVGFVGVPHGVELPIGQMFRRTVGVRRRVRVLLANAGYEVSVATVEVSSREAVHALTQTAAGLGDVTGLIHAAGVSPSQASPSTILKVDLYGTAPCWRSSVPSSLRVARAS